MKPRTFAVFFCCVLWAALTPSPAPAGEANLEERIVVHGAGAVEARPDLALLQLRIAASRPTSQQAMSEVAQMVARVGQVAADLGIAAERIATQSLTLEPQYIKHIVNGQHRRKRTGYRAAQSLRLEVADLESLPLLIDRLSESEILQLAGLQFSFAKPQELLTEARRRAIRNARARADLYAAEAGVGVGRVITIVEGSGSGPGPRPMALARSGASLPPGQRRLAANVTVTYAIRYRAK
jgi:uncharacterized protein YggE